MYDISLYINISPKKHVLSCTWSYMSYIRVVKKNGIIYPDVLHVLVAAFVRRLESKRHISAHFGISRSPTEFCNILDILVYESNEAEGCLAPGLPYHSSSNL